EAVEQPEHAGGRGAGGDPDGDGVDGGDGGAGAGGGGAVHDPVHLADAPLPGDRDSVPGGLPGGRVQDAAGDRPGPGLHVRADHALYADAGPGDAGGGAAADGGDGVSGGRADPGGGVPGDGGEAGNDQEPS